MMEPRGRFAQLLDVAAKKKNMSLRDLAAKLDYTYEQMRKIILGHSLPSKLLLKAFIKTLGMDPEEAEKAVTADRMERTHGKSAYTVLGLDPRYADVSDLMPQLNDQEWNMFVSQMRGFVQQRRRAK
jgi:transcriptional regulator with XRE-family HTH domain